MYNLCNKKIKLKNKDYNIKMVKLYYTPTSCGASSFICAHISNLNFDCEVVDLMTHKTESGLDFYKINPKGNVPCIVLDNGDILNENITCLEYIADISSNKYQLAPLCQTIERYKLSQILSFIASELHATIGLLFNPASREGTIREFVINNLDRKMKYLEKYLLNDNKQYVFGNYFTIADSYLHIVLSWTGYVGVDLNKYQVAKNYYDNICNLEEVKKAKKRMAMVPSKIC